MKVILSKEEALYLDNESNSKGYISNSNLMKNAGRLSAEYFIDTIEDPFNKKVLVIAGSGNNGGDALIMHYYLNLYGVDSLICFINKSKLERLLGEYKIPISRQIININKDVINNFDYFVDGIFGIGLNRPIEGKIKKIIELLNGKSVFSLDIPSGLKCNTGRAFDENVICKPKHVVSMGYLKPANIMNVGKSFFKRTKIIDINFPDVRKIISRIDKFLIEKKDILPILRQKRNTSNKYDSFCNLIVGSKIYSGAGVLAMNAALKGGASYAQVFVPDCISDIYKKNSSESKIIGLGNKDCFYLKDFNEVSKNMLDRKAPVLIGPGLGGSSNTKSFIVKMLKFLKKQKSKCVLDASGFEPLYSNDINIDDLPNDCILTPHRGEFDKIFPEYYKSDKSELQICQEVSNKLKGRVLVFKGATTIIVSRKKNLYLINKANSLLASAGSGDVLSGILIGLLSLGYDIDDTSLIGVYVHSLCSDIFYSDISKHRMLSADILDIIPKAFNEIIS